MAKRNPDSSPLFGSPLRLLSTRIAPLVKADLASDLVAELQGHFTHQLLPDLHQRVEEIVTRVLSERLDPLIARELAERLETAVGVLSERIDVIIARELTERLEATVGVLSERVDAIVARQLTERLEAAIDRALVAKQRLGSITGYDIYKPNNIVAGTADAAYMEASNAVAQDFLHPAFSEFCRLFRHPLTMHRKLWEWAFIYQRLHNAGMLRAGTRGLGFGVGTEPLSSIFASQGSHITATEAPDPGHWQIVGQYASSKEQLFYPDAISRQLFDDRVSFELCDMNDIPQHLSNYDFCWSSCSFEHLGSLQLGLDFVINSIERTLRIGGIACHTTELNLSSDDETIEAGDTVIYRKKDLERLCQTLAERGHWVEPLRISPGTLPPDYLVDVPPFSWDPHLKLMLGQYVTTSVGLVARRGR